MWEARVRPGMLDELAAWLLGDAWELMAAVDGFLAGELYRSYEGAPRLVLVTHWRDESALEAFAGAGWRTDPVVADAGRDYLAGEPQVWHFSRVRPP